MKGYERAQESYNAQEPPEPEVFIWACCGGIDLHEDERCPICGDEF